MQSVHQGLKRRYPGRASICRAYSYHVARVTVCLYLKEKGPDA